MNPRVVVVIGDKGVRLIRLVSNGSPKEEEKCLDLFKRVRKGLDRIDKELKRNMERECR